MIGTYCSCGTGGGFVWHIPPELAGVELAAGRNQFAASRQVQGTDGN